MDILFIKSLFVFLAGLCIGSFINVLVVRVPNKKSISGRSQCPECGHMIHWYDNIPLLSFLILSGKCRYCKKPISFRYPLVELTTALCFSFIFKYFRGYDSIFLYIIIGLIVLGVFMDFEYNGTFDISTIGIFVIYALYLCIAQHNLKLTGLSILKAFSFVLFPAPVYVAYQLFRKEKKSNKIAAGIIFIAWMAGLYYSVFSYPNIANNAIYYMKLFIPLAVIYFILFFIEEIITFILRKNIKGKYYVTIIFQYINTILLFLILFNKNNLSHVSISVKNVVLIIIGSIFYFYLKELIKKHDNNQEVIDNILEENDVKREENKIFTYLGDGDVLSFPFFGLVLGFTNTLSFFIVMGFVAIIIYKIILRKNALYFIPLYPYMFLSLVIIILTKLM